MYGGAAYPIYSPAGGGFHAVFSAGTADALHAPQFVGVNWEEYQDVYVALRAQGGASVFSLPVFLNVFGNPTPIPWFVNEVDLPSHSGTRFVSAKV